MGFFDSISNGFTSAWGSIKDFGQKAVNGISSVGKSVFNWTKTNIPKAVNTTINWAGKTYNEQIRPGVERVYNDISGIAKKGVDGISNLESGLGKGLSSPLAIAGIALVGIVILTKMK